MKRKEIINFLCVYSIPIGFGGWDIIVTNVDSLDNDLLARVGVMEFSKELELEFPKEFYKLPEKKQKNILVHELIHGRLLLKDLKIMKIKEYEEELFVNDVTTLVEEIK